MQKLVLSKWKEIDWKMAHMKLKTYQAELYEALKAAKHEDAISINNKILMSFSARAIAVRIVTSKSGGETAGVDKKLLSTDEEKYEAIIKLSKIRTSYKSDPVKRVWIPKADGTKLRPLGIPTIFDRCVQTLYNFSLDVYQEQNANPRSFGFRKGRSVKQVINYVWKLCSGAGKRYALIVDIEGAYDNISHSWLLKNIPMDRNILREWLKAGILEKGKLTNNESGTPQGGAISPTIFNITMNGIEKEIMQVKGVFPVRFADDITVLSDNIDKLEKVKEIINESLKPRGLKLNEGKTIMCDI